MSSPFNPNSYSDDIPTTMQFNAETEAPKKKKKGGCMKWGLGIAAVFVVFGVAVSGGDDDDEAAADSATETSSNASADTKDTDTEEAEADSDSDMPADFRSALRQANTYANAMHMSKLGVYDQLTSEYGGQFNAEAAQYAVDNVEADWNLNALESAKTYQDAMSMSPSAIHDQLTSEYGGQFNTEEADYAIANLTGGEGPSDSSVPAEFTSALNSAETYSDSMHMSKQGVYDQLTSEYGGQFTAEAAQYAVDNVEADWNLNALESAKTYQESMNMSPSAIWDQLVSSYGGQFTAEQADYAIANL